MSDDELRRYAETLADAILLRLREGDKREDVQHECPLADPVIAKKHEKHHDYIDTVLHREAKRAERWETVTQKSLAGLVWAGLVALGTAVWAYLKGQLK